MPSGILGAMDPGTPAATTKPATWRTFAVATLAIVLVSIASVAWWLGDTRAMLAAADRGLARLGPVDDRRLAATDPARAAAVAAAFTAMATLDHRDEALSAAAMAYDDDEALAAARHLLDDEQVAHLLDAVDALGRDPVVLGSWLRIWSDRQIVVRLLVLCARAGDAAERARATLLLLHVPPCAPENGWPSEVAWPRLLQIDTVARAAPLGKSNRERGSG